MQTFYVPGQLQVIDTYQRHSGMLASECRDIRYARREVSLFDDANVSSDS